MATIQIPIKANFSGVKATSFGQYTPTDAVGIANGGTSALTRQDAINNLTAVGQANVGSVLTKDNAGNATWATGGGTGGQQWQPILISGQNIKTVNGNSLLGSGDLVLGGGATISNVQLTQGTSGIQATTADPLLGDLRYSYNFIKSTTDAVQVASGIGYTHNFYIEETVAAGGSGGKYPLQVNLNVANATSGTVQSHAAITGFTLGRAVATSQKLYGINSFVGIAAGASVNMITGLNVVVGAQTGSTVAWKSGIQITSNAVDTVSGSSGDGAIAITAETGAVGWLRGIAFHSYGGRSPMNSATGVLMGTIGAATCRGGIDFSSYSFSTAALIVQYGSVGIAYADAAGLNGREVFRCDPAGNLVIGGQLLANRVWINVDGVTRNVSLIPNPGGVMPGYAALVVPY